jgi:arginine metabolism regulation protein II
MSTALGSDLVSGSIDASLAEVDSRLRDPGRSAEGDIVIGPFAVLDFSSTPHKTPLELTPELDLLEPDLIEPDLASVIEVPGTVAPEDVQNPSPSILDSLSHIDDFLHWSDLLSFSPDETGFASAGALTIPNDLSFDMSQEMGLLPVDSNHNDDLRMLTPQQTPAELVPPEIDALKDAPCLLKHFQNIVIPHIMAIPCRQKSPWKILNVPAAVVTYGDSTFLGTETISHARLANLYGLLACSAIHLVLNPSTILTKPPEYWWQVANQAYQEAKDHMQTSLNSETKGSKKAKYKDQLMATCILIQYAVSIYLEPSCITLTRADHVRPATTCPMFHDRR